MKNKISITLNDQIIKKIDSITDGLVIRNRSQAIEVILKKSFDRYKIAVVLLGGPEEKLMIGKKYVPEVEIKGMSLIEKDIKKLRENNFREIFIIARKKILESIFKIMKEGNLYGVNINYVEEKDSRGDAESLRLIKNRIKSSFLVLFGDIIFDSIKINDLWTSHFKNPNIATLNLVTYKNPKIKGEVFCEGNRIIEFNQKPKKRRNENSYLVFSPIFICEPELLQYHGTSLEEDIFPILAKKGLLNGHLSSIIETHIHNKDDVKKANLKKR
jgi:NDP-sugar pyrophosphorylase family protein